MTDTDTPTDEAQAAAAQEPGEAVTQVEHEIAEDPAFAARVGEPFRQQIYPHDGMPPWSFSVQSGRLPPGLTLAKAGLIKGVPTEVGRFDAVLLVSDDNGESVTEAVAFDVVAEGNGAEPGEEAGDGDEAEEAEQTASDAGAGKAGAGSKPRRPRRPKAAAEAGKPHGEDE